MEIVVLDEQLSLAIGRRGLNVRLAAKLTGWKLDVKSASRVADDFDKLFSPFVDIEGFNNTAMELLYDNGFRKLEDIAGSSVAELGDIIGTEGVDPEVLIERAAEVFHARKEAAENPPAEDESAVDAEEASSTETVSETEPEEDSAAAVDSVDESVAETGVDAAAVAADEKADAAADVEE
jgi:N utilization substance protein A